MFSSGQWLEKNGQFLVNWASQAYCNYSIFVGVLLLVISSIQTYRMSIFAYKGTDRSVILCVVYSLWWICNVFDELYFKPFDSNSNKKFTVSRFYCINFTLFFSSFLLTFIDAITCTLMCIFTINAALMITFGFMTWCNDMIERFPS